MTITTALLLPLLALAPAGTDLDMPQGADVDIPAESRTDDDYGVVEDKANDATATPEQAGGNLTAEGDVAEETIHWWEADPTVADTGVLAPNPYYLPDLAAEEGADTDWLYTLINYVSFFFTGLVLVLLDRLRDHLPPAGRPAARGQGDQPQHDARDHLDADPDDDRAGDLQLRLQGLPESVGRPAGRGADRRAGADVGLELQLPRRRRRDQPGDVRPGRTSRCSSRSPRRT